MGRELGQGVLKQQLICDRLNALASGDGYMGLSSGRQGQGRGKDSDNKDVELHGGWQAKFNATGSVL